MRLIDADELEKKKYSYFSHKTAMYRQVVFMGDVDRMPTIDAVPVIRCAECKHQEDCEKQVVFWKRNHVTEQNEYQYNKIDFCSYGEPKTET